MILAILVFHRQFHPFPLPLLNISGGTIHPKTANLNQRTEFLTRCKATMYIRTSKEFTQDIVLCLLRRSLLIVLALTDSFSSPLHELFEQHPSTSCSKMLRFGIAFCRKWFYVYRRKKDISFYSSSIRSSQDINVLQNCGRYNGG